VPCILRSVNMCTRTQGYVCGSMQAINVPSAKASVVTFWEGEVVDGRNHTFFTQHVRSALLSPCVTLSTPSCASRPTLKERRQKLSTTTGFPPCVAASAGHRHRPRSLRASLSTSSVCWARNS
jgi:hypothetical protein